MKRIKLGKILSEFRTSGISGIIHKTIRKILKIIFYTSKSGWFVRDLSESIDTFQHEISLCREFVESDKSIIYEWLYLNKEKYPWIYIENEIDASEKYNHIYYVLKENEIIISYVKIGINTCYIHDFKKEYKFLQDTAFIYDTFVHPEFRGRKIALLALLDVCQYLKNLNYKKIICHIEEWNKPSINVFQKSGFRFHENIRYVRLFFINFYIINNYFILFNFEKHLKKITTS